MQDSHTRKDDGKHLYHVDFVSFQYVVDCCRIITVDCGTPGSVFVCLFSVKPFAHGEGSKNGQRLRSFNHSHFIHFA